MNRLVLLFAYMTSTIATSLVLIAARGSLALAEAPAPMARYVVQKGPAAAPEIDGPGGVAAIALLVSVGLIAYNRFRNR